MAKRKPDEYQFNRGKTGGVSRSIIDNGCDRKVVAALITKRRGSALAILWQHQRGNRGLQ